VTMLWVSSHAWPRSPSVPPRFPSWPTGFTRSAIFFRVHHFVYELLHQPFSWLASWKS